MCRQVVIAVRSAVHFPYEKHLIICDKVYALKSHVLILCI